MRQRCREILQNLGEWLAFGQEKTIRSECEDIGKARFQQSIPLHEAIQGLCCIRYTMIDFVREQGMDLDSVALYAEEELERRVEKFFDMLIVHLARGYESEWLHALCAVA